jgi:hypothetical protein
MVISVGDELDWPSCGRWVALCVRDWGIGTPADDLPHVLTTSTGPAIA